LCPCSRNKEGATEEKGENYAVLKKKEGAREEKRIIMPMLEI
jgi:hypothetical protein